MAQLKTINQEKTMNRNSVGPVMSQKIFSMNLGVETVSLYLLCCAVADAGAAVARTTLQGKWNGSLTTLEQELRRLESRNILENEGGDSQGEHVYRMVDEKKWR
jgi:cytochrome c oxidase assembly protein Cox11